MTSPPISALTDIERLRAHAAGRRLQAEGPVGLVLGGGGAKGAYQVGCWKALRECGVARFDAIAGTSVGALNAVLVAQDDFARAESIWAGMRLSRVLRLRWHVVLAVLIRLLLLPVLVGRYAFPRRLIPVPLWRALDEARRRHAEDPDPMHMIRAALRLYSDLLAHPRSADAASWLVLGAIGLAGASAWWVLAAPVLTVLVLVVVAPVAALLVVTYAAWAVSALDFLATRLVLASNEPLQRLLHECADAARLRVRAAPLLQRY